jgi:geranylgeranyl diphosphate synthase, type I
MEKDFNQYIIKERDKINKSILRVFQNANISEDEPYLRQFLDYGNKFILRGGRRLLPICLVNTFIGISSDKDISELLEHVYHISASIELLHVSSLIIDDIVDREDLRRGMSTFHKYIRKNIGEKDGSEAPTLQPFEESTAIYGGNFIASMGTDIILNSPFDLKRKNRAVDLYLKGFKGITRGHLLKEYHKIIPLEKTSLEHYLILADLKRGVKMETAVGIGAILGNARESQIEPLMGAMNKIGIIEQIINDLNGSFGDPKKKSIDSDIKNGQRTILTIISNQSASPEQKKTLGNTLGNVEATKDEINAVREIYTQTGAVDFVKYYANSLKNDAYHKLMEIYPGFRKEIMDFFENLLGYIINYSG